MAVILLAGIGTRIKPIGNLSPKSLLSVGGKPLLWYSVQNLLKIGVSEFCFVVGFQSDQIQKFMNTLFPHITVHYVNNNKYNKTNSVYSYYLASQYFNNRNFFRLEGDLLYSKNILTILHSCNKPIVSAVEKKPKLHSEEYSVSVNTMISTILKYGKQLSQAEVFGEAKGIEYISATASRLVHNSLEELIKNHHLNEYAEVAYQNIINHGGQIYYKEIGRENYWCEIDTPQDLLFANTLVQNQHLV